MADAPEQIRWGTLTGTVVELLSDDNDAGRTPNERNVTGTILAVPSVSELRFPATAPKRLVIVAPLVLEVLSGRVFAPGTGSGVGVPQPGAPMAAADQPDAIDFVGPLTWQLTFRLNNVAVQPRARTVSIPSGGVLDLADAAPSA